MTETEIVKQMREEAEELDHTDPVQKLLRRAANEVERMRSQYVDRLEEIERLRRTPPSTAGWLPISTAPTAWRDVVAERRRQVATEGWSPEHDDAEHDSGQMARAAAAYALSAAGIEPYSSLIVDKIWPWGFEWWKPKDRRRDLVRAGALILAEIERLDRATGGQP